MKKTIFVLLILFLTIGFVSAGEINNDTTNYNLDETVTPSNYIITANESGHLNTSFSDDYKGYCIEHGEKEAEKGDKFYVHNTSYAINQKNKEDISNYLKTFFVDYYNEAQNNSLVTQHVIWMFTDHPPFNSKIQEAQNLFKLVKKNVRNIPDSGIERYNETHYIVFDFKVLLPLYQEHQNYFAYKISFIKIVYNSTIQINNSAINNNITLSPNICFNETDVQFDKVTIKEKEKRTTQSTSTPLKKHICGENLEWIFGWIIILIILILLLYKKD